MWVRIDDNAADDARIVTAGLQAFGLLVGLLCWSNRLLADGFVPAAVVRQRAGADASGGDIVAALVNVGLLCPAHRDGLDGYVIHADLMRHQPSREAVEAEREDARRRKDAWKERHRSNRTRPERDANANGTRQERRSTSVPERTRNANGTATERNGNSSGTDAPIPIPIPILVPDPTEQDQVGTSAGLMALWNRERQPGPKVQELTPERQRKYAAAIRAKPNPEDWTTVIRWANAQPFANACGFGAHANWRMDLDFLTRPGKLAEYLDKARAAGLPGAAVSGPNPAAGRVPGKKGDFDDIGE
jgi:hypothetical protein